MGHANQDGGHESVARCTGWRRTIVDGTLGSLFRNAQFAEHADRVVFFCGLCDLCVQTA
jgi:hypothetical protein